MARKSKRPLYVARQQTAPQSFWRRIPTWTWFAIGGVVAVLLVGGLFYLDSQSLRGGANVARGIPEVRIVPEPGAGHLNGDIEYASAVPPGGPHNPIWQNCGIYDEPIRAENAVHSMEHGAVWIAYDPDLAAEQADQLKKLVNDERGRLRNFYLLSPQPDLPAPIVATAWRVQLELDDAFDDRLLEFMQRFHIGPYTPERGATCSGGVGEPA
jgi:hypothetical protein